MSNNYLDSVSQKIEEKKQQAADGYSVKLATVTAVSGGRATIKFHGEMSASGKTYAQIDQYFPSVNDTVLVLPQGNTNIIIGRIINEAPTAKWSDVNHNHDARYSLSTHNHDNTYAQLEHEHDHIKRSSAPSQTLSINGSGNVVMSSPSNHSIGEQSSPIGKVYLVELHGSNSNNYLVLNGLKIEPGVNAAVELGSSNKRYATFYVDEIHWNDTFNYLELSNANILPSRNNQINLGSSSYQFKSVHAIDAYVNGVAVTSDKKKKKSIKDLTKPYIEFFKKLRPRSYKYIDGTSGRTHTGFVAQEVEEAARDAGLTNDDVAMIVKDEFNNYSLRYEELIAIQTAVIQNLIERVDRLEREVKS